MSSEIDKSPSNVTIKRRRIDFETKMKIFKKYNRDKPRISSLAQEWNISQSTVQRIIKEISKIQPEVSPTLTKPKLLVQQKTAMYEMEKLLTIWIEDQQQRKIPLVEKDTQAKAIDIYNHIKRFYPPTHIPFVANDEWLVGYKQRAGYRNLKLIGESFLDTQANAEHFPIYLQKLIEDEKYSPLQVFNVDRLLLFWKIMPDGTYISKEAEEIASDRVTVLLGCNAAGDCKLKPLVVYNTYKPRGVKNIFYRLPVHYHSNVTSWLTAQMFEKWFVRDFIPETRCYCEVRGVPFKILLILDTAPRYRKRLVGLHPNVKVIFLPKCVSERIQPMDQDIMSIFKAYYLAHTLNMVMQATKGDTDIMVQDFCESYNIRKGITNIKQAWDAIPKICLAAAWKRICPQFVDTGIAPQDNALYRVIKWQIILTAAKLGFEMNVQDVENLLQSSGSELTSNDLIELGKIIDDGDENSQINLADDLNSCHSPDASLFDDDCIDVTVDHTETTTQQSIEVLADKNYMTEYTPKPCTWGGEKNLKDSEEIAIDYIKIEEPQLVISSIFNAVPVENVELKKEICCETIELSDNESSQESSIINPSINVVNNTLPAVDFEIDIKEEQVISYSNELDRHTVVDKFKNPRQLPANVVAEEIELAFDHVTCAMEKFESVDPNNDRFQAVRSAVNDMLSCYREMFEENRHIRPYNSENR